MDSADSRPPRSRSAERVERRPDDDDPTAFGTSYAVFSGGTAFNSMINTLTNETSNVCHILPITDNGGSTREIVRVLGGPAIGDIRSRLIRLASDKTQEARAIKTLLEYRLPKDQAEAKREFLEILEGVHELWRFRVISEPYKQTVRAFLVHFFQAVLARASVEDYVHADQWQAVNRTGEATTPRTVQRSLTVTRSLNFSFSGASIGNLLFTGARLFFQSLEAAIFWFSNLSGIPRSSVVIPVLNVNSTFTIGVHLADGHQIIGQDNISHPPLAVGGTKAGANVPLPSPIKSLFYVNQFQQQILPPVNRSVLDALYRMDNVVYAMGSLYTSIIPSLVLKGVGKAVAAKKGPKIFILNGYADRETYGMSAVDHVRAICDALNQNEHAEGESAAREPGSYITDVVYVCGCSLLNQQDEQALAGLGLKLHMVDADPDSPPGELFYDASRLVHVMTTIALAGTARASGGV
jgi:cathepsin L